MGTTSLDAGIRKRLRVRVDAGLNQSELARAIGRSAGWLNKYIHGAGNATIDDLLAMARFCKMSLLEFIGLPPGSEFTAEEREIVDRFRGLSPKARESVRGLLGELRADQSQDAGPRRREARAARRAPAPR
jgi:transcriptional regulator with XRE-family HTH domain